MNIASENPSTAVLPVYRRRWFIAFLVLSLLVLLFLWLLPVAIGYGIKSAMIEQGAEQARVEDVDFNPFTGTLAVRGVQASAGGKSTLELPLLAVVVDWMPLWKKQAYIRSLDLQGLRLSVDETAEGALRIGGIRIAAASEDETPDKPEESAAWGYGIGQLRISDSEVGYQDSQLETRVSVQQLDMSQLVSWKPQQAADLTLSGTIDQAPLKIEGRLTPFSSNPEFNGQVKLEQLVLNTFSGLVSPQLKQLAGKLSVDTTLQARQQDGALQLQQQGGVQLQGLQIEDDNLQLTQQSAGWDGKLELAIAQSEQRMTLDLDGHLEQGPIDLKLAASGLLIKDQGFSWQGGINLVQQAESSQLGLKGAFRHKALDLAMTGNGTLVKNGQLDWSGELKVDGSGQATKVGTTGELKLTAFKFESGKQASAVSAESINLASTQLQFSQQTGSGAIDLSHRGKMSAAGLGVTQMGERLTEQGLQWQGDLDLTSSGKKLRLDAKGELQTEGLAMALQARDLDLRQGPLRWNGTASFGQSDTEPLLLQITGDFAAEAMRVDSPRHKVQLLAFDKLRLDGINLQGLDALQLRQVSTANLRLARRDDTETAGAEQPPALLQTTRSSLSGLSFGSSAGLHIEQLAHEDLHAIIVRNKDGGLNAVGIVDILAEIMAGEAKSAEAGDVPVKPVAAAPAETASTAQPGGLPVRVDELVVSGESWLLFTDDNVDPPYMAKLIFSEFHLSDIDSSKPEQDSPFTMKAKIGEYAQLNLDGKARIFDKLGSADIKGRIEALELPPLTAYAAPAIGYRLKSGQLDADIEIQIKQGQISGFNRLSIHQLEVAKLDAAQLKKYNIESAPPLDTGLGMLRDKNNTITLELPISGDLSKPEFNVSDALNQAIGKAMQKGARVYLAAALFPFGTMLAVAEMAGDAAMQVRLDPVVFAAGAVTLDNTAKEYLAKVAGVIKERPAIHVKVCGMAVDSDREILEQKLQPTPESKGQSDGEAADKQQNSGGEADRSKQQGAAGTPAEDGAKPAAVSSAQLKALAAERAGVVKNYLLKSKDIKASRLIACDPAVELKKAAAKPRVDLLL